MTTSRPIVAGALAGIERYALPGRVREDYLSSFQDNRFAESVRYGRSYPGELPALAGLLPQIHTSVLIIAGALDRWMPPVNAEFLHQRLPDSALEILDVGHFTGERRRRGRGAPPPTGAPMEAHDGPAIAPIRNERSAGRPRRQ